MKNRTTKKIKFLSLTFLFILFSCQKKDLELEIEEVQSLPEIVFSVAKPDLENIEDLENISLLLESLTKVTYDVSEKNNKEIKIQVDKKSLTLIRNGDYTSYTFRALRKEYPELFENLIITEYAGEYESYLLSYRLTDEQRKQVDNGQDIEGEYQIRLLEINEDFKHLTNKTTCYKSVAETWHSNPDGQWKYEGTCPHEAEGNFDYCSSFIKYVHIAVDCPESIDSGDPGGSGGGEWFTVSGGTPDDGFSGSGSGDGGQLSGTGFVDSDGNTVLTVATTGAASSPDLVAEQLDLSPAQTEFFTSVKGFASFLAVFEFLEEYNNSAEAIKAARKAIADLTRSSDATTLTSLTENKLHAEISSQLLFMYSGEIFSESRAATEAMKKDPNLNLNDWKFISSRKSLALRELQYVPFTKEFNFKNNNLKTITKHETEVSMLSSLKQMLAKYWPKNAEEWGALMEIMGPMLLEIGIEFIPGGGVFNSGKDSLAGISSGDYTQAVIGIVGIVMEFVPWAKLAKIAKKVYDVGKKIFGVFAVVYKFLVQVADAIKAGFKSINWFGSVRLMDASGNVVAKISGNTVEIITTKGLRLVDPSNLKSFKKISPSSSGYISKSSLVDAKKFQPSEAGLKADFDALKNLDNNTLGKNSEVLADKLFKQDQYLKQDAKVPGFDGNNGFDGVYIKKDASGNVNDIIINEVKQVSSSGTIQLNPGNISTGLPIQMTNQWIDNVIARMKQSNASENAQNLAVVIENAKNQGKVTKVVTGIDKTNNQVLVFTIN